MKRSIVALAAIFSFAGVTTAEEVAPGTPVALLAHESVQKELKLSKEQLEALSGLAASVKKGDSKLADALALVKKELKADQLTRLKEIGYQVRGGAALLDKDVIAGLKFSDKKVAQLEDAWANEEKTLRMLLAVARFRNAEAMRSFIVKHRKAAAKKLLALLSDDEKTSFTKMQGKAFTTDGLDGE